MNIGILGSANTPESMWLEEEAKKRGHNAVRFSYTDFVLESTSDSFNLIGEIDLKSFDTILVRGMVSNYSIKNAFFNKSTDGLTLLSYIHNELKIPVVDESLVTDPSISSKIHTAFMLTKYNLPLPKTYQFHNIDNLKKHIGLIDFPIIIKHPSGMKGQNIYLINSREELDNWLSDVTNEMPFLFQEFLPNDGDIRVIVVGYKAIGAMKRHKIKGDFRANVSQGADASAVELNEELIDLAEKAAKASKIEVAGVDLIQSNGKYYIIEVNRTPQFKGFTQYTGVNPSKYIIDYLETKINGAK